MAPIHCPNRSSTASLCASRWAIRPTKPKRKFFASEREITVLTRSIRSQTSTTCLPCRTRWRTSRSTPARTITLWKSSTARARASSLLWVSARAALSCSSAARKPAPSLRAATIASRTTSSSSPSPFSRTAWSPVRATHPCRKSRKPPNPFCAISSNPCPFPCERPAVSVHSTLAQLWARADRPAVRAFLLSITALTAALLLALYSGAAAELGQLGLASTSALAALVIAGWVAVTLVPVLAKRTPLRWIGYKMEYHISREGWIYFAGIILVALAALNTGNNLLFLILSSLVAIVLMSGILSSITLSGIEMRLLLPEHIFAGQPVRAVVELENAKLTLPSFSLRVEAARTKGSSAVAMLETPVYFPYLPKSDRVQQVVPMLFPRRGVYRQEEFRIVTRFPFGFLQKARHLNLKTEALVYPSVEPTEEYLDILPGLQGALESLVKGRGQDLYALRDYLPTDSARHVHWKASARLGSLMVREFTREDESRILLVLDPHLTAAESSGLASGVATTNDRFERAVTICASLAWHFYERNFSLQFRSAGVETALAHADQIIFAILRHLALAQPLPPDPKQALMTDLAASPDLFKIIVTSQPHGSIPAPVWSSSYVVFLDDPREN